MPITAQTPPALAKLITDAGRDFKPDHESATYADNLEDWQLYLALYELTPAKLRALVEKHHADEDAAKYANRQQLAAVYNLVPMIVRMIVTYIYGKAPAVQGVEPGSDLAEFLADCDGAGTSFEQFSKEQALPLALVLGWVDVLVQNPAVLEPENPASPVRTQADVKAGGLQPTVFPITPLQRIDHSCRPNGEYNWIAFTDAGNDDGNPLARGVATPVAYVTLAAAQAGSESGFWVRSWKKRIGNGAASTEGTEWEHDADYTPTQRVPVATLYHQRSADPEQRHFGLSKIATIAVLTKQIVQILNWTAEDVLANLALYCFPSKGGRAPGATLNGDDETPTDLQELNAFTRVWFDRDGKHVPMVLQGDVAHVEIKLKLVGAHIQEILRIANLLGASGAPAIAGAGSGGAKAQSGVGSTVERNELFRELTECAAGLDRFWIQTLALAESWVRDVDVSAAELEARGVSVQHNRGPYALAPLLEVIQSAQAAVELFGSLSPTASEHAFKGAAAAVVQGDPRALQDALEEIENNTGKQLAAQDQLDEATQAASVATAEATAKLADEGGLGTPAAPKAGLAA